MRITYIFPTVKIRSQVTFSASVRTIQLKGFSNITVPLIYTPPKYQKLNIEIYIYTYMYMLHIKSIIQILFLYFQNVYSHCVKNYRGLTR